MANFAKKPFTNTMMKYTTAYSWTAHVWLILATHDCKNKYKNDILTTLWILFLTFVASPCCFDCLARRSRTSAWCNQCTAVSDKKDTGESNDGHSFWHLQWKLQLFWGDTQPQGSTIFPNHTEIRDPMYRNYHLFCLWCIFTTPWAMCPNGQSTQ